MTAPDPWWEDCVIYQVYPRSFADSDGDGFGDLRGIIGRLDAIAKLGVGAIWLSPVYPSPGIDNGYDISDYCDVDPRFGTLADFDELVASAGERGIRIIMDLVINHTSDEHPWFEASRRREEPYTDFYIWRPPAPDGGLPNNWTGFFTEDAWTFDEVRGEYYLHLFHAKQPDLNYANPQVLTRIKDVLRFWLDRGVAGFRCDVINLLDKATLKDGKPRVVLRGQEHFVSREGVHDIVAELRRDVLDPYGAFAVGEAVLTGLPEAKRFSDPQRHELHSIIKFEHLEVDRFFHRYVPKPFSARRLLEIFTRWQQGLHWNAPYLESHDQPRIVSHYGDDGQFWHRSAVMLAVLVLTLRGTPIIYQGQEIGMTNFDLPGLDALDDVEARNVDRLMQSLGVPQVLRWKWMAQGSRDNARTPMQWDASDGAGFTTGTPWLGINANHEWLNWAAQDADEHSVLAYYRRLIALRLASPVLRHGNFDPVGATGSLMAYRRTGLVGQREGPPDPHDPSGQSVVVVLNFSSRRRRLPGGWIGADGQVLVSNIGRSSAAVRVLEPWEALVVRER